MRRKLFYTTLTALSGRVYYVDLRASRVFDFNVSVEATLTNELTLRIHADGAGVHTLEVKTHNLKIDGPSTPTIEPRLGHDVELIRHAQILASGTPWVIVVIPDGSFSADQRARLPR